MNINDLQRRVLVSLSFPPEFIITVKTDNAGTSASNQILLPIQGNNMVIDWGDGSVSTHSQNNTPNATLVGGNNVVKTYASAGTYQIKISPRVLTNGDGLHRIFFNNGGDRLKLLQINNWGKALWSSMQAAFRSCVNMRCFTEDKPVLNNLNNLNNMFAGCSLFNHPIGDWDFSTVNNFIGVFNGCLGLTNLNSDNWNLTNVTGIGSCFQDCQFLLNLNVKNWNISTGSASRVFNRCNRLNVDLSFFLTTNVNLFEVLNLSNSTFGTNLQEGYSRTLIGWANNIFSRGGVVTGRSLGAINRRYNNINYVSGQQFNNAVDARNYLVNTLGWTISGDALI